MTIRNQNLALFWFSVVGLYLELLLIRWVGTEVRIFAYLQNTILVVCFLGLGAGFFSSGKPIRLTRMLAGLGLLCSILTLGFLRDVFAKISQLLSALGGLNIWYGLPSELPVWRALLHVGLGLSLALIVMVLILEVFVPLGRILGRLFSEHPRPILAYSCNVAGSLVGTWVFVWLSSLSLQPWHWFVAAAVMMVPLLEYSRRYWVDAALIVLPAVLCLGMVWTDASVETVWSPYQKLSLEAPRAHTQTITVNNVGYQAMMDLSDARVAENPDAFDPAQRGWDQYVLPAKLHPDPKAVLIVGAGSGNDAAGALRGGAERVTAVEIDPAIIDIGSRYHKEKPYDSDRVQVVNEDARSFFTNTDQTFDVISFGLLDSHTTTAMTNARLDHYVYTRESLEQVKKLLRNGGIITLNFEANKGYIADRMSGVLEATFGHQPVAFRIPGNSYGWGGVMFLSGDSEAVSMALAEHPGLQHLIRQWDAESPLQLKGLTRPATDDWPYIYLEDAGIPPIFFLLALMLVLLVLYLRRYWDVREGVNPMRWERDHWHFAFLGAGFLLLEVQNISKASVVLGNTWVVNAVIISGVLVMVLLANWAVLTWRAVPVKPVLFLLCASVVGLYFLDLSVFASLPTGPRMAVVGLVSTAPLFFSGIVFAHAFAAVDHRDHALGANLLGALVGASLQSISFLTGVRFLLILVLLLYVAAFASLPSTERPAAATA